MRKIIGFKIEVRPREVLRRAKKAGLKMEDAGWDQAALELWVAQAAKAATPSVIFDTFPAADPDSAGLSSMPGLAYNLVLATLGPEFESSKRGSRQEKEALAPWWGIVEEAALDEIFRFASSLLTEEAEKESCVLSPLARISDGGALEKTLAKVPGEKIGVAFSEGRLTPESSAAASLSWLAKAKTRSKSK